VSRTKRDEVRDFMLRRAEEAILLHSARMGDRVQAETVRSIARQMANSVAFEVCDEYRFFELADIMEWKRQRVRR